MTHNSTPADELADDETCTDCHGSGFNEVMERRCDCNPVSPDEQIAANLEAIRQCQIEMAKNNEALRSALAALRQPPSDAIRNAVIEQCAKVADEHCLTADNDVEQAYSSAAIHIADAIRALAQDNHIKGQDNAG